MLLIDVQLSLHICRAVHKDLLLLLLLFLATAPAHKDLLYLLISMVSL